MTLSPYFGTTETQLFTGYRRAALVEREVPCACGGRIVAVDIPASIATAVAAHVTTPRHRRWRSDQDGGEVAA